MFLYSDGGVSNRDKQITASYCKEGEEKKYRKWDRKNHQLCDSGREKWTAQWAKYFMQFILLLKPFSRSVSGKYTFCLQTDIFICCSLHGCLYIPAESGPDCHFLCRNSKRPAEQDNTSRQLLSQLLPNSGSYGLLSAKKWRLFSWKSWTF